ncbi:histidine kinase [Aeromicrobium sp.]|uniref:sensor histidine kinase n=1 Tax=Aeromicrobium sp. TaxID=1871063 RepID=UPI0028A99761|nr:histidine kinase [Aeromicrobium sp.]
MAVLVAVELLVWDGDTSSRFGGTVPATLLIALAFVSAVAAVATWRWPVPASLVVWACALVAIPVPAWQPFGAVLVALYVVARTTSAEVSRPAFALALVPLGVNAWNSAGWRSEVTAATLAPVAGIWLLVAFATWWAGRAGHRSASRVQDLEETLRRTEAEVRAQERRAIARDLHDIVAHAVTAMVLRSAGARAATTDPDLTRALQDVEASGAQAIRELHRLLHTMHGTDPSDADRRSGLADLGVLVDRTRASGLVVELIEHGPRRALDASVDLAAFRCVQEALSNAMRHGGAGTVVEIVLRWDTDLRIEVTSHGGWGVAPDLPRSGGFGLVGLSERLASVGGALSSGPTREGFRVDATLPAADAAVP